MSERHALNKTPVQEISFGVTGYGIDQRGAIALDHDGALGLLRDFSGSERADARRKEKPPLRSRHFLMQLVRWLERNRKTRP